MESTRRPVLFLFTLLSILLVASSIHPYALGDDWPQWRGSNRDGISSERGLLKEWQDKGPRLLWQVKDIGGGYSTPSVVGDRLYVMANRGMDDESVKALSVKDGSEVWSTRVGKVGPNENPSYPGSRSTPTVHGDSIYALSSDGDLVCLETATGKVRWKKNVREEFSGVPGMWAYSESPLVDGDVVVCAPGGGEATLVALNRKNGEVVWKCAVPGGDQAAYASAIVAETGGIKQYVQLLQKGLVGVNAKTGVFLWRFDKPVSRFNANIPTPVVHGDIVYAASAGTGGGAVRLNAKDGGVTAEQIYFDQKLSTAIGGTVKLGDYLYGTTGQAMICTEFATGKLKWQDRAIGTASLCFADGRLYLHGENGDAALVEPSPDSYRPKGRFTPPDQPKHSIAGEKAWAYPVVANGRLYLRDLGTIWCYDVRAGRAAE